MATAFFLVPWLDTRLRAVASTMPEFGPDFDPMVRVADPRHADLQANGVLAHAKRAKANPRALGEALAAAVQAADWWPDAQMELVVAGPGFLNFSLTPAAMEGWLAAFATPEALKAGAAQRRQGQTVVIDYSAPNTAKEMHVGHIRSTVIGEALARLLTFTGAKVIRDNHIGDWGTQFGMLIWAIKKEGYDLDTPSDNHIAELEALYKQGNAAYKADATTADAIRAELVKLQSGDPENTAIWEAISRVSWEAFATIYHRLGITFDQKRGESFYRDMVDMVYAEMTETGIAQEDQGALVVFHPEHKRFAKQPFIVRKADGASNYATTDLATIHTRVHELAATELLYVVDKRQSDHFEQLFLTAKKWLAARDWPVPAMKHISFGTVLGEGGRPIKTKEGGSIKLRELLDEAVVRTRAIVAEKNPELPADEQARIAEAVGLGAVKYADLAQNRTSDYQFSWEKMLALEGNTAPYLLYAVARIHSILRKADVTPADAATGAIHLETDAEIALARKLVGFGAALDQALEDLRPHFLCGYLFELAGTFSTFYNATKVLVDEAEVKTSRLALCAATLQVLETGLELLGLETLERM